MINSNTSIRVTVFIEETMQPIDLYCQTEFKGKKIDVVLRTRTLLRGWRRLFLKFSIMNDSYYLSDHA